MPTHLHTYIHTRLYLESSISPKIPKNQYQSLGGKSGITTNLIIIELYDNILLYGILHIIPHINR